MVSISTFFAEGQLLLKHMLLFYLLVGQLVLHLIECYFNIIMAIVVMRDLHTMLLKLRCHIALKYCFLLLLGRVLSIVIRLPLHTDRMRRLLEVDDASGNNDFALANYLVLLVYAVAFSPIMLYPLKFKSIIHTHDAVVEWYLICQLLSITCILLN